ncbi:SpoIIE family protein phosphatase [Modestobacter sp. VKM Ac-2979]|uniref:SpoIIE family protein phosphatase n=1 Tax=unclassified Modestobacter TaxID=2643866 RepID=UPI0022AB7FDE|nr:MULTISPECIES: SpoIIE family protein phosphatase [unclassified Modestobacter]MCZ2811681.1 SpoIIE family protein phosphatase [Modestobacter sp. VKM Ac-2979]MCZ2843404.1 SpoIIE family protein phosphatase [Modestobacter sp. VKM Ac-2980]
MGVRPRRGRVTGSLPLISSLPAASDPAFERFARLVRRQLGVPVSLVTMVSAHEQVFPGAIGLPEPWQSTRCTPLSHSFCQHVVRSGEPLVIGDARIDPLVADNLAIPDLHVIAYAGIPLTDADGVVVGSLCAIDSEPRTWTDEDLAVLTDLAGACSSELQLRQAQHRTAVAAAEARELRAEQDADRSVRTLALDAGQVGTFALDLGSGALTVDDRLLELSGMDRASFSGRPDDVYAHVHPDDVDDVVAGVRYAIEAGGTYEAEYRIALADGSHRWVAARGEVVGDDGESGRRLVGVVHDSTSTREPQERAAQIVDEMAVGFIALGTDWVMTHVNREAERILGLPRWQMLGQNMWEVFPAGVGSVFEHNYRTAAATGQPVVFDAYYPRPLNIWVEVRAVPSPSGLVLHFVDITSRVVAQQQAEQVAAREQLLSRITEDLSATLDGDEAAQRLAQLVVPAVADWCVVTGSEDDRAAGSRRGMRTASCWHTDPDRRDTTSAYAEAWLSSLDDDSILVRALTSGQMQLVDSGATAQVLPMITAGPVRDLLADLAPEAVAVLPLPGRDGPVGLLTLANGTARGAFAPEDLVTARNIADRAGLVLDNARLYRQQRDVAEGLQRSLLTAPPQPDHGQIVVRYVPASQAAQVGGDFYDAFLQPDGAVVLAIGDVAGHDTEAAAAMGQLRTIVRTLGAHDHDGPATVLSQADQVMETLQSHILATAAVARLEQTDQERAAGTTRVHWSNAGHPPPMVIHPDGRVEILAHDRADLMLGVDPSTARRESQVEVGRDSVLLLYTDGLVERRDQDLDTGTAQLQAVLVELAGSDLDELCDTVLARMLPGTPDDDVALIAVRLHPQDRPRPAEAGPHRIPPNVPAE